MMNSTVKHPQGQVLKCEFIGFLLDMYWQFKLQGLTLDVADEGQFRVFDPYAKKIIIDEQPMTTEEPHGTEDVDSNIASRISIESHDSQNQKLVEKFLGTELPIVRKSKNKFCCDKKFNSLY